MTTEEKIALEARIIAKLKDIQDPEIPVNIYDLGLIYKIDISPEAMIDITMTLTNPNCPVADSLLMEVHYRVKALEGVSDVNVNLVFDPEWDQNLMTEDARLELGLL